MADTAYTIAEIEQKWQSQWETTGLYDTPENPTDKFYLLEMFAYPSGDLHMGHFRNYTIGDAIWRYLRMQGKDLLHPFGWDAFGMPAEQAAIKNNLQPKNWTLGNIETSKATMKKMSISYDWDREIASCLPDYYKWTQWVFLQLHKAGLTYRSTSKVNWCETCQTVLANDQAKGGVCWRCENDVQQKEIEGCWFFKYSSYAEKLHQGLDELTDWPSTTVNAQREWIGKSSRAEIDFQLDGRDEKLRVFTTRPDTLYGVTFMAIAPEHPLTLELCKGTEQEQAVNEYVNHAAQKTDRERTVTSAKEKDGVFSGAYAIHPMTGERIQLWVADYVLASYGSGAVMAVPAHDERDFAFARKYDLPIRVVIKPKDADAPNPDDMDDAFATYGTMVNSDTFDGLSSKDGIQAVCKELESRGIGNATTQYKLRDWLVSRQRYWGCPIPIIHCDDCGAVPVPDDQLPARRCAGIHEYRLPVLWERRPARSGHHGHVHVLKLVPASLPGCEQRERTVQQGADQPVDADRPLHRRRRTCHRAPPLLPLCHPGPRRAGLARQSGTVQASLPSRHGGGQGRRDHVQEQGQRGVADRHDGSVRHRLLPHGHVLLRAQRSADQLERGRRHESEEVARESVRPCQ
jgi:leucyl-tRNA synthetase